MYSREIQERKNQFSEIFGVDPGNAKMLIKSMSNYLGVLASYLEGQNDPPVDTFSSLIDTMMLSTELCKVENSAGMEMGHYFVGMSLEQSSELLVRTLGPKLSQTTSPLENDLWYQLLLAFLHYLSGGFRVQAFSVMSQLRRFSAERNSPFFPEYKEAIDALTQLLNGYVSYNNENVWAKILFEGTKDTSLQLFKISKLSMLVRQRQVQVLQDLGMGEERVWLNRKGIDSPSSVDFWTNYLRKLERRGFSNFTKDQMGPEGFHSWLNNQSNMLVTLPTGAGKTIVGELRTAIALANGHQVLWLLPTRSLVRQTRNDFRKTFESLEVDVEELPITEDFDPIQLDSIPSTRYISVTTPEKALAFLRADQQAITRTRLVVCDEAQKLFDTGRGTSLESVLLEIHQLVPECKFVLMSAQIDAVEELNDFLSHLIPDEPITRIFSSDRPTRRINGIITDNQVEQVWMPKMRFYPPKTQNENVDGERGIVINLVKKTNRSARSQINLARLAVEELSKSNIKSVLFVGQPKWTQSQSKKIADSLTEIRELPQEDCDRLQLELGRESLVQIYGRKGVSPHHAGLTSLEQHIAEKWIKKNVINTIVATSTLAEGVNLPFDASVVSFLRRNLGPQLTQELPLIEIQNMLGRAGRAGQVSDGVCLLSMPNEHNNIDQLDQARRYFFRIDHNRELLGLSSLLIKAQNSQVGRPEWLEEYNGLSFSECQTLVSFVLNVDRTVEGLDQNIERFLMLFPSLQHFPDIGLLIREQLVPLTNNLMTVIEMNPLLNQVLLKTGFPYQFINILFDRIGDLGFRNFDTDNERMLWADEIIHDTLINFQHHEWEKSVLKGIDIANMISAIELWRSGASINELETAWAIKSGPIDNQIGIGKFFNSTLSLVSQFWGCLKSCERILYPDKQYFDFENIQAFTREGVSSTTELILLNRLGGMDRVLAHRIAQYMPTLDERAEISQNAKREFYRWKNNRGTISRDLSVQELGALISILDE